MPQPVQNTLHDLIWRHKRKEEILCFKYAGALNIFCNSYCESENLN